MPSGNGNKFKGNKAKKARRLAKAYPDFDPAMDQYAKVVKIEGGRKLSVNPLESNKQNESCYIPGKFHRKVWVNIGDIIIVRSCGTNNKGITKYEMQGKPRDGELASIQNKFDKFSGEDYNPFGMANDFSDSDDEEDDKRPNFGSNESRNSGKSKQKVIPPQPVRDHELNDINDNDSINIDDI